MVPKSIRALARNPVVLSVALCLAFAPGSALVGALSWAGLHGVSASQPYAAYSATVPHQAYMIYQCMFAVITPALITGAIAERMSFKGFLVFSILWITLIYDPLAHWVWGVDGWIHQMDRKSTRLNSSHLV